MFLGCLRGRVFDSHSFLMNLRAELPNEPEGQAPRLAFLKVPQKGRMTAGGKSCRSGARMSGVFQGVSPRHSRAWIMPPHARGTKPNLPPSKPGAQTLFLWTCREKVTRAEHREAS